MKFVKKLGYAAGEVKALAYLRKEHDERLPAPLQTGAAAPGHRNKLLRGGCYKFFVAGSCRTVSRTHVPLIPSDPGASFLGRENLP